MQRTILICIAKVSCFFAPSAGWAAEPSDRLRESAERSNWVRRHAQVAKILPDQLAKYREQAPQWAAAVQRALVRHHVKNQNLFIIELEPGNHYAIVLTDGKHKFSLVTVDIVSFPPPVKDALVDRLAGDGWTKQQLMLLPSHSHTSIDMNAINPANAFNVPQIGIYNPRVFDFVIARLAQVVQDAQRQMTPVSIGTSSISIDGWNRNRRGGAVTDKELTVTRVDSAQGKPLAALINFTAHPTFMSGEDMLFSGDWPGYLQRTLESLIGDGVVAMYYNGAEGDQCQSPDPQPGPAGGNARSTTAAIWPSLPGSSGSKRQREKTSLFLITCTLSRCPSTPHIPIL